MSHFTIDFQISFERETLEVLKGLIAKPQAQPQAQASKMPSLLDDEECPICIPSALSLDDAEESSNTSDPHVALLQARARGVKLSVINDTLSIFNLTRAKDCPEIFREKLVTKLNALMPE